LNEEHGMIVLIALPIIALILIIVVFSMMRGIRQAGELHLHRSPLTVPADRRKASDDYHEQVWLPLCEKVADAASSRLGRPLTAKERRTIWRARTELVLDVLLDEVKKAGSPEEVHSLLASLPSGMDRPDSSGWCETGSLRN
jgi:hypothetical protein